VVAQPPAPQAAPVAPTEPPLPPVPAPAPVVKAKPKAVVVEEPPAAPKPFYLDKNEAERAAKKEGKRVLFWIDGAEEKPGAETIIKSGGNVEGWKLVEKRATKKWADEADAEEYLSRHLEETEYLTTKIITPTQATKLLEKQGVALAEEFLSKKEGGLTLAKDSDKRPSVITAQTRLATALSKL